MNTISINGKFVTLPMDVYFGVKIIKDLSEIFKEDMYAYAKITNTRKDFKIMTAKYESESGFGYAYLSNLRFIAFNLKIKEIK